MRAPSLALFTLSLVALFSLLPGRAQADSPFEGKWTEGPLKEEYTVLKWQKECEAAPVNGSSGGGETVSVHSEGDELSFIGGGRVFRTNQCYDQMPTLSRESHTRSPSGREWRTRCTTPPSDPRRAVMNTLVIATSDTHIDIVETGRYESQLVGGLCTADIKRSRSFDLVAHDTPTPTPTAVATAPPTKPVAPEPASNGTDSNRCASPGDPTRLEARPSRKLLRTGETFGFRGLVLDASGCVTRTPTTWTVDEHASKALSVDSSGRVTVATDAPEGSFEVVVSAAGKSTRVTVDVASPARYDALLQQSGLNDAGENDAASVVVIAASQIGGSDARAEDGSKRRRSIFLFIVGVLAVVLAAVAVIASRRTKRAAALEREAQERYAEKVEAAEARKREKTAQHTAAMRAHELSVEEAKRVEAENVAAAGARPGMVCPACQREYSPGSAFCPNDANRLVPLNISPNPLSSPPGPSGSICPTCKRGYDPGVKVCPHDKDDLVPYAQYASRQPDAAPLAPRGKICPTCGNRFEGPVEFCGKDGTALVLLN